ncbi:MAG TPA: hypothetical protein VF789_12990 [Thermoanaerobaculia bacterium]
MRSHRNLVLGATLSALIVAGTLWAGEARRTLPLIKAKPSEKAAAAQQSVGQVIIDTVDHYESSDIEQRYHAQIADPNISFAEKCDLAIRHRRLELLSSDLGGTLGGTRELGRSTLHIRLLCPQQVAEFEIPANFEVHAAPHPEEVKEMSFDTDMYAIEGRATDVGPFASFQLVGGTSNGFKSPGHTSLIPARDGALAVDSTFNIGYRIVFEGAKDGPLGGASGVIESSILMKAVGKSAEAAK